MLPTEDCATRQETWTLRLLPSSLSLPLPTVAAAAAAAAADCAWPDKIIKVAYNMALKTHRHLPLALAAQSTCFAWSTDVSLLLLLHCNSQLELLLFAVRDVVLALTLLIEFPAACVGSAAAPAPAPSIVINAPRSIRKLELDATQPVESIHQTYQS
ncbi:uncharacterized protein Dmoj_GI25598 [Drosophila mojavensis]|uniref:Uncharacterized protein n=1 Tax=Drosophila mojavensis TaxID=7230 RepID=A0A0Q9X5K9_DROMO|nr:uncharacterized protein Dmoj_GI25598 [Drosophila mojavensis]